MSNIQKCEVNCPHCTAKYKFHTNPVVVQEIIVGTRKGYCVKCQKLINADSISINGEPSEYEGLD